MTTFKLYFGEEDIRRITLNVPDWDNFNRELVGLYPQQFHPELRVMYKDDEGDLITISTQKEWEMMLESVQGNVKKVYISEGKNEGMYFKDGPPAVAVAAYTEGEKGEKAQVEEEELVKKLEIEVPKCLERLLPGGKLTPYNLPSWLQGCVEVKRIPGTRPPTVDLDVDICTLFESLHKQALSMIGPDVEPQLLRRAKDFLQSMIDLAPQHPLAHYNLACAEALLGELNEAVASLKRAIEAGYSNVQHLLQDTDLTALRNLPDFQALVDLLRQKAEQPKEEEVAMEEVVTEPVPEVKIVKEEEKKVEPVPEVKKEEEKPQPEVSEERKAELKRWAAQLDMLASMGFSNTDVNIALLKESKGDVVKVVNALLFAQ